MISIEYFTRVSKHETYKGEMLRIIRWVIIYIYFFVILLLYWSWLTQLNEKSIRIVLHFFISSTMIIASSFDYLAT